MRKTLKSNQLSRFFLLVFVGQLFLLTVVSFSMDSNIISFDTEVTAEGDLSDELDAEEGDFSLLMEEELEKEYFPHLGLNLVFPEKRKVISAYFHSQSLLYHFKNYQPPECVLLS